MEWSVDKKGILAARQLELFGLANWKSCSRENWVLQMFRMQNWSD